MTKQTKNILIIAVVAYVLLTISRRQQPTGYPAAPGPKGSPEWIEWAQRIISAAGGLASDLFGPGGPFHKEKKEDIAALVEPQQQSPFGQVIY